ncbi:hypothetical protein ACX12M_02960 [Cellulosimicrobium cellulans]
MPANSHADKAADRLVRAYTADPEHAAYLLADAQAEATLAVAFELRTANVLAALLADDVNGSSPWPGHVDTLRHDALARLGYGGAS